MSSTLISARLSLLQLLQGRNASQQATNLACNNFSCNELRQRRHPLTMLVVSIVSLLVPLLSAQIVTSDGTFATEDDVLVLNPDNFQLALQRFPALMVQFYAPWCPHCQALAPKFRNAASKLTNFPVKLAKLDANRFQRFAQQHDVNGYPTLMFYRNGVGEEYEGAYEENAIVRWVSRHIRSPRQADPVLELTGSNFGAAISEHPFLMVQFYAPWCPYCQELAPIYAKTATELTEKDPRIKLAKLDATKDRSLAEWYGAKRYPTLVFFRHGVPLTYEGARDQFTLVRWMLEQVERTGQPEKMSVMRFRSDDGQQPAVAETTTTGTSRRVLPVMVNLIAMVVVSTVLG